MLLHRACCYTVHVVTPCMLLHRACCRVTQLLHQQLHVYKIYKLYIRAVVGVIIELLSNINWFHLREFKNCLLHKLVILKIALIWSWGRFWWKQEWSVFGRRGHVKGLFWHLWRNEQDFIVPFCIYLCTATCMSLDYTAFCLFVCLFS